MTETKRRQISLTDEQWRKLRSLAAWDDVSPGVWIGLMLDRIPISEAQTLEVPEHLQHVVIQPKSGQGAQETLSPAGRRSTHDILSKVNRTKK